MKRRAWNLFRRVPIVVLQCFIYGALNQSKQRPEVRWRQHFQVLLSPVETNIRIFWPDAGLTRALALQKPIEQDFRRICHFD